MRQICMKSTSARSKHDSIRTKYGAGGVASGIGSLQRPGPPFSQYMCVPRVRLAFCGKRLSVS